MLAHGKKTTGVTMVNTFKNTGPVRTGGLVTLELIYHTTVREIRKSHRNALIGILLSMFQAAIFIMAFYLLSSVLGMRQAPIRGDFMLYMMTGVFLFLTHTKSMSAVFGAENSTSAMVRHAPLNTAIMICAAALGALYMQSFAMMGILLVYHLAVAPVHINDPINFAAMFLLAWYSGIGVGLVFAAIKPWLPSFATIAQTIYARANMIASGKMFVANATPGYILALFSWNPLFHIIDQARGFMFINYFPHHSNLTYPIIVSSVLIVIGLLGEFYTRKNVSISMSAGR